MRKEEQVREMARLMCNVLATYPMSDSEYNPCKMCEDFKNDRCNNSFRLRISEVLYDAGYKKE